MDTKIQKLVITEAQSISDLFRTKEKGLKFLSYMESAFGASLNTLSYDSIQRIVHTEAIEFIPQVLR